MFAHFFGIPPDVTKRMPVWEVNGLVARYQQMKAKEDFDLAYTGAIPLMKPSAVRSHLSTLTQRISATEQAMTGEPTPRKVLTDDDYTQNWKQLVNASHSVVVKKDVQEK